MVIADWKKGKLIPIYQEETKNILTKSSLPVGGYSVNPYVGCTHACKYCYFETLEVKAEKMAKKYACPFVDNEMPYGRVPQGHPVIVDYFYHKEIRGTENTGKRNR